MTNATNEIDLSASPQVQPSMVYTNLGREIYIANARFMSSWRTNVWSTAAPDQNVIIVDDWAVRLGSVDLTSADQAATGNMSQALELNGGSEGEIAQELHTTPGHRVTIKLRAGHNNSAVLPQGWTTTFAIQVNDDRSTRVTYDLGRLDKLIDGYVWGQKKNYWHEVTYSFRARGYDVLQFRGNPNGGNCGGALITEVRAFETPWT